MDFLMDYIMLYFNMIVRILLMIAFYLITSIISERIRRSYHYFAFGKTESGTTASAAAIKILHNNDIYDITVIPKAGLFSNSFSRRGKRITLSEKIYTESSITASAIAAEKTAHAVVVLRQFSLISFLIMLKPVVRVITSLYIPLLLISTFVNIAFESNVILYVFIVILALQVITLPAGFYANRIALRELRETGILNEEECYGAKKVLHSLSLSHISTIVITLIYVIRF